MKIYLRRLIGYFIFGLIVFTLAGVFILNKPYADLREHNTQVASYNTQTQIMLITLNAPTNTLSPTLTRTPFPTMTNTSPPPTLTLTPPCEQVVSDKFFIFSEPSIAVPSVKVDGGTAISLLGRLEGESWWRVLDPDTKLEGWVPSSDISMSCSLPDKQIDYWLGQKNIIYDVFRGLHPWTGGKTEITSDGRMKFFYTQNTKNFAGYDELVDLGKSTEIRLSFKIDLDKIKAVGLRDQDSFVIIKLTDAINNSSTEFKLYFDCSYTPNASNIRPRLLQTCEKRKDYFILMKLINGDVQISVNGENVPLYSLQANFGYKNISLELGAYPEVNFDYIFVTSE